MGVNLCFTCVAEEALFHGFIQAQLARLWQRLPGGGWLALKLAASCSASRLRAAV